MLHISRPSVLPKTASVDDKIGTEIKVGRNLYKITQLLKRGTFGGDVFVAQRKADSQEVVIKFVKRKRGNALESTILQKLRKLNAQNNFVVEFHDKKLTPSHDTIVMEKMDESLLKYKAKRRRLDLAENRTIVEQILRGLVFLHQNRFIHADIKPENIGITKRGDTLVIKIIDFGLTYHPYQENYAPDVVQTTEYRAPEVFLRYQWLTPAMDVWSVAIIAIELHNGCEPFSGIGAYDVLKNIIRRCGKIPDYMMAGAQVDKYFNKTQDEYIMLTFNEYHGEQNNDDEDQNRPCLEPLKSAIVSHRDKDSWDELEMFREFVKYLLMVDPAERPSAKQALECEFFKLENQ